MGANASNADSDETDSDGLKTLCEHGQSAPAAIWMFFHLAEDGPQTLCQWSRVSCAISDPPRL